jgi:hypothetical protein
LSILIASSMTGISEALPMTILTNFFSMAPQVL